MKMKKNKTSKKNVPVVPGPMPVPANVESIPLTTDDAEKLRNYDQQLASAKVRIADLELQLSDLQAQKNEAISQFKNTQVQFIADINKMATAHGIELDANKDARRWNLDTNQMVFQLLK